MLKSFNKNNTKGNTLYHNILLLSRNKLFYTKFDLADSFQNLIHLIFIHISFLFIKIKQKNGREVYKNFYQKIFDLLFSKIELNMREIGYGDVVINKNMRSLVKNFYNILINCENFEEKSFNAKNIFMVKYLDLNKDQNGLNNTLLINYFDKYRSFCFDLSSDSVLKGNIKFNYK